MPENTPACTHFLRGACTKDDCRYLHVNVQADARVCPEFARNGFCSKGIGCEERHVRECPSFSNSGICKNKSCRLPHIARAAIQKGGQQSVASADEDDQFAGSSDSDESTDDYESEAFDEDAFGEFVKL